MPTILITGCSSGFGHATALHFLDRGWDVVATMRKPEAGLFAPSSRLRLLALDVTEAASIAAAVAEAGPLDALVNNAGIGWMGPLEGTPLPVLRQLIETNTIGTIAMTQAVLPQFRAQKAGVVVNITSSVTLLPLPLLSAYTASKAAINAFTTVLALELEPLGIRARLVLPGRSPETRFGANARALGPAAIPDGYETQVQAVHGRMPGTSSPVTEAHDVAEAVWRAVTDPASPPRIAAGADALALPIGGF